MTEQGEIRYAAIYDGKEVEDYIKEDLGDLLAYMIECAEPLVVRCFADWIEEDSIRAHRWILDTLYHDEDSIERTIEVWISKTLLMHDRGQKTKINFFDPFGKHTLRIVAEMYDEEFEEWYRCGSS